MKLENSVLIGTLTSLYCKYNIVAEKNKMTSVKIVINLDNLHPNNLYPYN